MRDLNSIANDIKNNIAVTTEEYLYLLKNSDKAFWGFVITNNPGNINNTLRHKLGYIELGFNPDLKAISAQIEMMLKNGDLGEIATVKQNFVIKNSDAIDANVVYTINQLLRL